MVSASRNTTPDLTYSLIGVSQASNDPAKLLCGEGDFLDGAKSRFAAAAQRLFGDFLCTKWREAD
jgi:hypothetical protein